MWLRFHPHPPLHPLSPHVTMGLLSVPCLNPLASLHSNSESCRVFGSKSPEAGVQRQAAIGHPPAEEDV